MNNLRFSFCSGVSMVSPLFIGRRLLQSLVIVGWVEVCFLHRGFLWSRALSCTEAGAQPFRSGVERYSILPHHMHPLVQSVVSRGCVVRQGGQPTSPLQRPHCRLPCSTTCARYIHQPGRES